MVGDEVRKATGGPKVQCIIGYGRVGFCRLLSEIGKH